MYGYLWCDVYAECTGTGYADFMRLPRSLKGGGRLALSSQPPRKELFNVSQWVRTGGLAKLASF